MLEEKIERLTLAVEALTKAIGGMQAPAPMAYSEAYRDRSGGEIVKQREKEIVAEESLPNAKPETLKSSPTTGTSPASSSESVTVTYDDVKKATNAVSKISRDKAIAGLARFGVSSATKLTEQQWGKYVAYMTKVAVGELDPEASHE